jgi:hypothetical protein
MNEPKIVITMTSWVKRINYVAKAIYRFLTTQLDKPDIFYLWLSEEEFPNKEKDLPEDLLLICNTFNIKISWTKENEYCHKRWYVYPLHYNDIVIAIDDDCIYDKNLINFARTIAYNKIVYTIFNNLTNEMFFNNDIKINYKLSTSCSNKIKLSGNSIYPPGTFPLEAISEENIKLRKKYCKKCDESWIMPFLIFNNIPRSYSYKQDVKCNFKDPKYKNSALYYSYQSKNIHWKHLQIYIVLRLFPQLMNSWKHVFPAYNDKQYKNKSIDELILNL